MTDVFVHFNDNRLYKSSESPGRNSTSHPPKRTNYENAGNYYIDGVMSLSLVLATVQSNLLQMAVKCGASLLHTVARTTRCVETDGLMRRSLDGGGGH